MEKILPLVLTKEKTIYFSETNKETNKQILHVTVSNTLEIHLYLYLQNMRLLPFVC